EYTTIEYANVGVQLNVGSTNSPIRIRDSILRYNGSGIAGTRFGGNGVFEIDHNQITANGVGIGCGTLWFASITDNTITSNLGDGLCFTGIQNQTIQRNLISGNGGHGLNICNHPGT